MRVNRGSRAVVGLAWLAMAAVLLAGCATAPEPEPTIEPSPEYTPTYVTPDPTALAPLTGAVVPVGELANPSLAAKIDNHPNARPQVGLDRTDIVFEEMVEGGMTRYVAIWQSDVPKEIGPVRSIRPMDPDIVSPFGGIIAYSGGQYRFVVLMQNTNVYNAVHGSAAADPFMYRTTTKAAPHNVLVKASELVKKRKDLKAPKQQFSFSPDVASSSAVVDGTAVGGVKLRFGWENQVSWSWDAEAGRWLRSQDGKADKASSGKRLSADNIVIVRVPVSHGLGVPKTELIGSGKATVMSGGKAIEGRWSKASQTGSIRIVDENGAVIRLAPGNSWIELVPSSGGVKLSAPK